MLVPNSADDGPFDKAVIRHLVRSIQERGPGLDCAEHAPGPEQCGIEAIACYRSPRHRTPGRKPSWGIYIFLDSFICYARMLERELSGMKIALREEVLYAIAFHKVVWHELYHFRFDCLCLAFEAANGISVYKGYQDFYARQWPGADVVEESLANRLALAGVNAMRIRHRRAVLQACRNLLQRSPPAYRRIDEPRESLAQLLAETVLREGVQGQGPPYPESVARMSIDIIRHARLATLHPDETACPVHLVA